MLQFLHNVLTTTRINMTSARCATPLVAEWMASLQQQPGPSVTQKTIDKRSIWINQEFSQAACVDVKTCAMKL